MWPYWVISVWKVPLWKVRSSNRLSILKLITQNLCSSGSPTDTCFYFCITGYVFQQKNRLLILLFIIYCALESVLILWFIIYCALESVIDIVIYYILCTRICFDIVIYYILCTRIRYWYCYLLYTVHSVHACGPFTASWTSLTLILQIIAQNSSSSSPTDIYFCFCVIGYVLWQETQQGEESHY